MRVLDLIFERARRRRAEPGAVAFPTVAEARAHRVACQDRDDDRIRAIVDPEQDIEAAA